MATTTISNKAAKAEAKEVYVPYNERFTQLHNYDIKVKATVADLARKICNHNNSRGFTSVLLIGDSGSGKTTFAQRLNHEIHTSLPYVIKHFREHQILKIKSILHALPKYKDYLLKFDDVSFLIKKGKMSEADLMDMFHELTKVRHTVKGKVIAEFLIHYPYAIEKFMRQAGYRVLTSITDDEREIYIKLFGPHSRGIIEQFIIDDRYQTEESQFWLPNRQGKNIKFKPKDPFKLAVASRMGDLSYVVYDRVDCKICADTPEAGFDHDWLIKARARYNPKTFYRVVRWFGYIQTGISLLPRNDQALYNDLFAYMQTNTIDFKELLAVLKDVKKYRAGSHTDGERPSNQEIELYMMQRLKELDLKMQEQAKALAVPETELQKDAAKEPEPESEDQDDDEDSESNDLEDSILNQFGGGDSEGEDQ